MKKQNIIHRIFIIFLAVALTVLPGFIAAQASAAKAAEEEKVSGEIATSVLSAYIWRGQELTRHSAVIQPSVTISYRGFSANIWSNLDTRPYSAIDEKFSPNFTESDVTLSYEHSFGIVSLGVGYSYYGLGGANADAPDLLDSQEVFVSVGLDTILSPTLTVYKEIDHYHQWYATLGISHTFALHEKVGLELAATVSYLKSEDAETYPKFDENSLPTDKKFNNVHDGMITASLPVSLTDKISLTPTVSYVFPLSNDARYEMRGRGLQGAVVPSEKDATSFIYGGIALSFAF